jgi:hypothetical protein
MVDSYINLIIVIIFNVSIVGGAVLSLIIVRLSVDCIRFNSGVSFISISTTYLLEINK